jgi:hypothetical protein
LNLITVNIEERPTQTTDRVVMVLGGTVDAQPVTRTTHAAA